MTIEERRSMWAERVEEHKTSGQSVANWCRVNDVNIRQFYKWRSRLSSKGKTPNTNNHFILATPAPERYITDEASLYNDASISIKIGVAIINVQRGFDEEALTRVVRAVVKAC